MKTQQISKPLPFFGEFHLKKTIDEYVYIVQDVKGELYELFILPKEPNKKNNCKEICPYKLKRWHFTCWRTCRRARVYRGQLPSLIHIRPYTLLVHVDRPRAAIKDALLKKVHTIEELLAN